jgi:hypothetical protein
VSARQEQTALTTARRLDDRQRAILRALYDYKVLLTLQIKILFFNTERTCQDELKKLADLGLVEREELTQQIGVGRAQPLWTLTESGIRVVAVMLRKPRSQIKWMPRNAWHESNGLLAHQLGINRFFVSLAEASLSHPGHGLHRWTPESYVRLRDAWIKHDGFGRYLHPGGAVELYLEFDRATEHRRQLQRKLYGYVVVSQRWTEEGHDYFPNLLVVVPTDKRERHFELALADELATLEVPKKKAVDLPFFMTSDEQLEDQGVLGRVWRRFVPVPEERPLAPMLLSERLSLVELPAKDPSPYEVSECLGRLWTDELARARRKRGLIASPTYPVGRPPEGDDAA